MNRKQKEVIIKNILDTFEKSKAVFIVDFQKVNSTQTTSLRKMLSAVAGKLTVVKNSLLILAAKQNNSLAELNPFFKNQIALVYAFQDVMKTASMVRSFLKNTDDTVNFKIGFMEKKIDKNYFEKLSLFQSEKEIYSRLCGSLKSPMTNLVFTLKQISEKLNQ